MIDPRILVTPDDVMRESERESINRLPDLSDYESGGQLSDIMRILGEPVSIHRKAWEYALCIHGLSKLGAETPNARALAVGAGYERPLFYYANKIQQMVASDLYDNPDHEGQPAMLTTPENFSPFPYVKENLLVRRMSGDDLQFSDEEFDFVFCLSSIEHFGSRDVQRKALNEMKRVLKVGGFACIITELILNDSTHDEYYTFDEVEDMFLKVDGLNLVGGDLDLRISESLIRYPVDLDRHTNVRRSPHLVLTAGGVTWTSLSLFFERTI